MALVKHTFKKGDSQPPLSPKMLAELEKLQAMSDNDIDLSDAPETLDWSNAVRGNFLKNSQENNTSSVLDKDVFEWLSKQDNHTKIHIHDKINNLVRNMMNNMKVVG